MDRLDEMARVVRDLGSAIEGLRASTTTMQGRLTVLESQLGEALAAQARLAGQLEPLRLDRARLASLERSLSQFSDDRQQYVDHIADGLRRSLDDALRRLTAQTQQASQVVATLAARLEAVETKLGVDDWHRQLDLLGQQIGALAARLDDVQQDWQAMQEASRQREARAEVRLADLTRRLGDCEQGLAAWQTRIEAQSETVRQSRALAEQMVAEVKELQRAQHELAETQRVWQERMASSLAERQASWDAEWHAFLAQRGQERGLQDAQRSAIEASLQAVQQRLDELAGQMERQSAAAQRDVQAQSDALRAHRKELGRLVAELRDGLGTLVSALEAEPVVAERPSPAASRRRTPGRQEQARRGAAED